MYKLSEDIKKSVLFNEFMNKSTFRTYHVMKQRSDVSFLLKKGVQECRNVVYIIDISLNLN
jgi:hypothetical protein